MAETIPLTVQVALKDGDAEDLDALTRQLSDEFRDMGVERVEPMPGGDLPAGAKGAMGVDPNLLGILAISVGQVLLPKFLDFLHAWAMRREGRTVKVRLRNADGAEFEVDASDTVSLAKIQQLISLGGKALAQKPAPKKTKKGKK
jgi:hypothetical protein